MGKGISSPHTLIDCIRAIYAKLAIHSVTELVALVNGSRYR